MIAERLQGGGGNGGQPSGRRYMPCAQPRQSQSAGRVMMADREHEFEVGEQEFIKIYAIMGKYRGFGRNPENSPSYIKFISRETKDAARHAFGGQALRTSLSSAMHKDISHT